MAAQLLNACEQGDLDTIRRLLSAPVDEGGGGQDEEEGVDESSAGGASSIDPVASAADKTKASEGEGASANGPDPNGDYNPEEDEDEDDDDEDFYDPEEGAYSNVVFERATTESRDRWRITPLGAAIMGHQLEAVDLLISLNANVNGNIEGSYLLHYACAIGGIGSDAAARNEFANSCVQKLIAAGARSDTVDEFLRTPLHIAAGAGLHPVLRPSWPLLR